MKLSEMIASYGDDDVQFQKLDDCALNISMTKNGSRATFVTPETFGFEGFDKLGLILWFDRERVAKVIPEATMSPADQRKLARDAMGNKK